MVEGVCSKLHERIPETADARAVVAHARPLGERLEHGPERCSTDWIQEPSHREATSLARDQLETPIVDGVHVFGEDRRSVGCVSSMGAVERETADRVFQCSIEQRSLVECALVRASDRASSPGEQREVCVPEPALLKCSDACRQSVCLLARRNSASGCMSRHPAVMAYPIDRGGRPLCCGFFSVSEQGGTLRELELEQVDPVPKLDEAFSKLKRGARLRGSCRELMDSRQQDRQGVTRAVTTTHCSSIEQMCVAVRAQGGVRSEKHRLTRDTIHLTFRMFRLPPYARLALAVLAAGVAVGTLATATRLPVTPSQAAAATRPPIQDANVQWFDMHVASATLGFWTPTVAPAGVPPMRAASGILVDMTTGEILWARDPHRALPPASLTKVLTSLVALENFSPDQPVTVTAGAVDHSSADTVMGLKAGQILTVGDLLTGMLLPSGDDAAGAIALDTVGMARFVAAMNAQVAALGLYDSHFTVTAGLDDPGLYASAYDLAVIAAYTYSQFPLFDQIVDTRYVDLPATTTHPAFHLRNLDSLLYAYPAAIGIKPGWTGDAGACLIGMAVRKGHHLLAVLMNANYPARLEGRLFDWGFRLDGLPPLLPPTTAARPTLRP